jgi:hypothetical protein
MSFPFQSIVLPFCYLSVPLHAIQLHSGVFWWSFHWSFAYVRTHIENCLVKLAPVARSKVHLCWVLHLVISLSVIFQPCTNTKWLHSAPCLSRHICGFRCASRYFRLGFFPAVTVVRMCDVRLPSTGLLRSVRWFAGDVSLLPICPIVKGQAVQEEGCRLPPWRWDRYGFWMDCWHLFTFSDSSKVNSVNLPEERDRDLWSEIIKEARAHKGL